MSNSFATPWTIAHQALLSMGFPRKEYWGGLPGPFPGDLPDAGIEPASPAFPVEMTREARGAQGPMQVETAFLGAGEASPACDGRGRCMQERRAGSSECPANTLTAL